MGPELDDDAVRAMGARPRAERLGGITEQRDATARPADDLIDAFDDKLLIQKELIAALAEFCVHLHELNREPCERSARTLARAAELVRTRADELGVRLDPRP
jgi:hypothetical protein